MAEESQIEAQDVPTSSDNETSDAESVIKVINRCCKQNRPNIPPINIPEKIILCLDLSSSCSNFVITPDKSVEPLVLLKQSLLLLIHNKLDFNPNTEIAVMLLNGLSCCWYTQFSSNKDDLCEQIKRISVNRHVDDSVEKDSENVPYCMDPILSMIYEKITLPQVTNSNILPPYVVRSIFFYSRSKMLTITKSKEPFRKLVSSPYFNFDSFYLHDIDIDDSIRMKIIQQMVELDQGSSYILESDTNIVNFMNTFSLLLAHSLQRPKQNQIINDMSINRKYFKM